MSLAENETGRSIVKGLIPAINLQTVSLHLAHDSDPLTVLHDLTDDANFVETSTATLCSERFLENDLNTANRVFVPGRVENNIGESKDEQVVHHFLAKTVVNSERFILSSDS
jgi:hypothetical protein